MTRRRLRGPAALLLAGLSAGDGGGPGVGPRSAALPAGPDGQPVPQPALRNGNTPAINYYGLVRPAVPDQRRAAGAAATECSCPTRPPCRGAADRGRRAGHWPRGRVHESRRLLPVVHRWSAAQFGAGYAGAGPARPPLRGRADLRPGKPALGPTVAGVSTGAESALEQRRSRHVEWNQFGCSADPDMAFRDRVRLWLRHNTPDWAEISLTCNRSRLYSANSPTDGRGVANDPTASVGPAGNRRLPDLESGRDFSELSETELRLTDCDA